jgi:DNA polymerase
MPGFEIDVPEQPAGAGLKSCSACGLFSRCLSSKMPPSGSGNLSVLFIGEAPGVQEDKYGKHFVGRAGQRLRRTLQEIGVDLNECYMTNAIICKPPKNRTPSDLEIATCQHHLLTTIDQLKPRIIVPLGSVAVKSLMLGRIKKIDNIYKWRGWQIPDRDFRAWICPTFHPSYIEHLNDGSPEDLFFKRDLSKTIELAFSNEDPASHWLDITNSVHILDKRSACIYLRDLIKHPPKVFAFDFETTGKKPHREGHRIICCGISTTKNHSVAFWVDQDKKIKNMLRTLLTNQSKKIAANIPFEAAWSEVILGVDVQNWIWDTCLGAHLQDNRSAICGMKFQAYVNYGIPDYDSRVADFLTSEEDSANAFNRVDQANPNDLMFYCGLDALIERNLADKQRLDLWKE